MEIPAVALVFQPYDGTGANATIWRGGNRATEIPRAERNNLAQVAFKTLDGKMMTWGQSITANYTDGIVVVHQGRIVYEKYFGALDEHRPHIIMRGIHGQALWIDPKAQVVIARLASNPIAANTANDPISLPAYMAIARELMKSDPRP